MKYILNITIILLILGCSKDNPVLPKENIIVETIDKEIFQLELNTWSPDDIRGWSTRGGELIVYLETGRFSQNRSDKYFEVDQYLHRGIVIYQRKADTIIVLGLGSGKFIDGFNETKEVIYPNETYRYTSRVDSITIVNIGEQIFYSNFWYKGEFNFNKKINRMSPILGKILGE